MVVTIEMGFNRDLMGVADAVSLGLGGQLASLLRQYWLR